MGMNQGESKFTRHEADDNWKTCERDSIDWVVGGTLNYPANHVRCKTSFKTELTCLGGMNIDFINISILAARKFQACKMCDMTEREGWGLSFCHFRARWGYRYSFLKKITKQKAWIKLKDILRFGDRQMKERIGRCCHTHRSMLWRWGLRYALIMMNAICVFIGRQSLSACRIGLALILFRRLPVGA